MKRNIAITAITLAIGTSTAYGAEQSALVGFTSDGNLRNTTISATHYNKPASYIQAQFNCSTKTVNVLGETNDATKAADLNDRGDTVPVTAMHPYFAIMGRVCAG